jgi:hypothetical protein
MNLPPDGVLNAKDIRRFVECAVSGSGPTGACVCADVALPLNGIIDAADVAELVNRLLAAAPCP